MRSLAAPLQPNPSISADDLIRKVDLVVPSHRPLCILEVATRHQVSAIPQQRLVEIALVAGSDEDGVDVEQLQALRGVGHVGEVQRTLVTDVEAEAVLDDGRVLDVDDVAVGEDAVRPLLFCFCRVAVPDALRVEGFVDVLEEIEADDPVVGALVLLEGLGAEFWVARVGAVYPAWVENFVYAVQSLVRILHSTRMPSRRLTKVSRRLAAEHRP